MSSLVEDLAQVTALIHQLFKIESDIFQPLQLSKSSDNSGQELIIAAITEIESANIGRGWPIDIEKRQFEIEQVSLPDDLHDHNDRDANDPTERFKNVQDDEIENIV